MQLISGCERMYDIKRRRSGKVFVRDQALEGGKILLLLKTIYFLKSAGRA